VAPVRGRDQQRVDRSRLEPAVELGLEPLPARVTLLERQVVAHDSEALAPRAQQGPERGQLEQVLAMHLDQPEALRRELAERSAHGGRLARAALAVEQHVERGLAAREGRDVRAQLRDRALDTEQCLERVQIGMRDRRELSAPEAERQRLLRVGRRRVRLAARERVLEPFQHALDARQQVVPAPCHGAARERTIALRA